MMAYYLNFLKTVEFLVASVISLVCVIISYWSTRSIRRTPKISSCSAMDSEKQEFLEKYRDYYGYANGALTIEQLRASEFSRLNGTVYLDHAGATLYSETQLKEALLEHNSQIYGNPHSQSSSSIRTSEVIESARQQVLAFFRASSSSYKCIFTSGATAGLKLVGETFPWTSNSNFLYTMENHNSVLGIREYALAAGATSTAVDLPKGQEEQSLRKRTSQRRQSEMLEIPEHYSTREIYNLFALPTECNFSGTKFNMEIIKQIRDGKHVDNMKGRWMVLLDAAKGSSTSPPDLSQIQADFLVVSFYKIFGYPTGLGALIIHNDAVALLKKKYFGGGTVAVSIADLDFVKRRESVEQWLEDGTVSYMAIAALRYGFEKVNRIGMNHIAKHTWSLTHYAASQLCALRHKNGETVCVLYGNHVASSNVRDGFHLQGPVVTFNLKRSDGSWVGYREVEKLAALSRINLRTGCFCNPGACAKYLGLSNTEMQVNFEAGHVCWDDHDIINGKPTGAVRVSFGYMSTIDDCQELINFIKRFFLDLGNMICQPPQQSAEENSTRMHLKSITIYPIKSCAGFSVESWPVVDSGLLYDREWLIADNRGVTLTQKRIRSLCLITPSIDLHSRKMIVWAPNMDRTLELPLEESALPECEDPNNTGLLCRMRDESEKAILDSYECRWFTDALGIPCSLIRKKKQRSFANEGQFLLVSDASVRDLRRRIISSDEERNDDGDCDAHAMQFRPNLVFSGGVPYIEDTWQSVSICRLRFPVLGGCNRCQMINIDQNTGQDHPKSQPLITLANYRRSQGKILFGMLLGIPESQNILTVGSPLVGE